VHAICDGSCWAPADRRNGTKQTVHVHEHDLLGVIVMNQLIELS
jgi:hypothetical protein